VHAIAEVSGCSLEIAERARSRDDAIARLAWHIRSPAALRSGTAYTVVRERARGRYQPDPIMPDGGVRLIPGANGGPVQLTGMAYPASTGWVDREEPTLITREALADAAANAWGVPLTANHTDDAALIACTAWNNLDLWSTKAGLWLRAWPLHTAGSRAALTRIQRGDVRGLSIGHRAKRHTMLGSGNQRRRVVTATELEHIALSIEPAADGARVWIANPPAESIGRAASQRASHR
jgi:phage head maturation protease